MTMRYEGFRQDDPVLRDRVKELAKARHRFGYRRLHVLLRRDLIWSINRQPRSR
jgi:putative transposase